jgi:hypothetical protein
MEGKCNQPLAHRSMDFVRCARPWCKLTCRAMEVSRRGKDEAIGRRVTPVLHPGVRALCRRAYPGHPKGCPNFNRRETCPPQAPLLERVLDLCGPIYCVYNRFDLGAHVARMTRRHPDWSERRLLCCLYWQPRARKQLREKVQAFLTGHPGSVAVYVPEACGVDVTATMASIGVALQWPPRTVAYQVALVGAPARKKGAARPGRAAAAPCSC